MTFNPSATKEKLETVFQPLLGEPITDMMRYVGCQRFEIGVQKLGKNRKGEPTTYGDWFLVVSCDWSITQSGTRIVSSDDFGPKRERRDASASSFYDRLGWYPPYIQQIHAEPDGELRFKMTDGFALSITPRTTNPNRWSEYGETRSEILRDGELWRFFPKAEDDDDHPDHWVMTRHGLWEADDRNLQRFFDAVRAGDRTKVRTLLEQGIRPQQALEEEYGTTLRYAAIESTPEIVRLLMEYGIGTNETPSVIAAARSENIETLRLFLERGGDINEQNEVGCTPLMEAASWGNLPLVQFLVEHGANVDLQTPQGETAFLVAVSREKLEVVEYLRTFHSIRFKDEVAK